MEFRRLALFGLIGFVATGAVIEALPDDLITIAVREPSASNQAIAASYHEGACTKAGVTLVVDFGIASDKEPIIRCATDFAGTGWDLFAATDIKVAGTLQYPTGFVCRIENWPIEEDCRNTPTVAAGTWVYFLPSKSSATEWSMSGTGASTHRPGCGSSEGWLFISGDEAGELNDGYRYQASGPSVLPVSLSCSE